MEKVLLCALVALLTLGYKTEAELCGTWEHGPFPMRAFPCPGWGDGENAKFCCGTCRLPYCCSLEEARLDETLCRTEDQLEEIPLDDRWKVTTRPPATENCVVTPSSVCVHNRYVWGSAIVVITVVICATLFYSTASCCSWMIRKRKIETPGEEQQVDQVSLSPDPAVNCSPHLYCEGIDTDPPSADEDSQAITESSSTLKNTSFLPSSPLRFGISENEIICSPVDAEAQVPDPNLGSSMEEESSL